VRAVRVVLSRIVSRFEELRNDDRDLSRTNSVRERLQSGLTPHDDKSPLHSHYTHGCWRVRARRNPMISGVKYCEKSLAVVQICIASGDGSLFFG
jgi:hypothetical protein